MAMNKSLKFKKFLTLRNPLRISKKGMFFTFIAVLIVFALLIAFSPTKTFKINKIPVIKTRLLAIDNYVQDLDDSFLERALKTTTYNGFNELLNRIKQKKEPVDVNSVFYELLTSGEIDGEEVLNETLPYWFGKLNSVSSRVLRVSSEFLINSVVLDQTEPFEIEVLMDVNYSIESELARWDRNSLIKTVVRIEGLDDPLHILNGYENTIRKTNISVWGLDGIGWFTSEKSYRKDAKSPNFLMRFLNVSNESNCCGIESLLNVSVVGEHCKSYVDYCFFFGCDGLLWENSTIPGFKLESYHIQEEQYDFSGQNVCN